MFLSIQAEQVEADETWQFEQSNTIDGGGKGGKDELELGLKRNERRASERVVLLSLVFFLFSARVERNEQERMKRIYRWLLD